VDGGKGGPDATVATPPPSIPWTRAAIQGPHRVPKAGDDQRRIPKRVDRRRRTRPRSPTSRHSWKAKNACSPSTPSAGSG